MPTLRLQEEVACIACPKHWGTVFLVREGEAVVPLLASAADVRAGQAPVTAKPQRVQGAAEGGEGHGGPFLNPIPVTLVSPPDVWVAA